MHDLHHNTLVVELTDPMDVGGTTDHRLVQEHRNIGI